MGVKLRIQLPFHAAAVDFANVATVAASDCGIRTSR